MNAMIGQHAPQNEPRGPDHSISRGTISHTFNYRLVTYGLTLCNARHVAGGLLPGSLIRLIAHMASRGNAPGFSSGSIWAASLING
jgi:hypothetical protein